MIGAIMTGGQSRRMGFNKAFIEIDKESGETILSRTISIFNTIFDETVIVTADASIYTGAGVPVLTDIYPDCGSLGGIFTALKGYSGSEVFVAACDMPQIDPLAIRAVISAASAAAKETVPFDVAIPYINSRFHPLHALYRQSCTNRIEEMLLKRELRVQNFILHSTVLKLAEADFPGIDIARSVTNVNRPEELQEAGISKRE